MSIDRSAITNVGLAGMIAVLGIAGPACGTRGASKETERPAQSAPEPTASSAVAELTRVTDRSLVCMVNNQFMGKPQIPIEVEGRTYFGCCDMCKTRLGNDPGARKAIDPTSKREVDKATAVIARRANGSTLYFENEGTFEAYARDHHGP